MEKKQVRDKNGINCSADLTVKAITSSGEVKANTVTAGTVKAGKTDLGATAAKNKEVADKAAAAEDIKKMLKKQKKEEDQARKACACNSSRAPAFPREQGH